MTELSESSDVAIAAVVADHDQAPLEARVTALGDTAHATELQLGSPRTVSLFCSVVRTRRSGRGWADTAHTTELQLACLTTVSLFCSVVRIGRSGRGWADTALTTELQLVCPRTVSLFCSVVRIGRSGRGWADTAHATELQPCFETGKAEFESPGLFCVSCAFSRLSPALPVSDPGRSVYRGLRGERGGEGEPVPRTYFCRDIAAAKVGGALTRRRYPFRLSPRIQISPTFNCTPEPAKSPRVAQRTRPTRRSDTIPAL